jgi:hypothetical protein
MKPSQNVNETRVSQHDRKTHFGRVSKAQDRTVRSLEIYVRKTNTMQIFFSITYFTKFILDTVSFPFEIRSRISMAKAAFNKKRALFTSKMDFKIKEETSKLLHL